ncbi:MAG: endo-1,4-beta-xylanase [Bryobacteraceae bacterium]
MSSFVNRRGFFANSLASLSAVRAALAQNESGIDLRRVAAKNNLLTGSAVSYRELHWPAFTELLAEEAGIVVSENDMKWQTIHPAPDRYDFARGDALVVFARAQGQLVRGHNLCWHEQNPAWLHKMATPRNAAGLLGDHIATVAGHYAGKIQAWDVVNEAIHVKDGLPGGFRNSLWYELLGPRYIDIAFHAARKADAHALLTYNDYDLAQDSPEHESKRRAVLGLLRSLRERKVPIDALGIQSHLRAGDKPYEWGGLHRFLAEIEALKLQVFVTELDVNDTALPADTAARDRGVAALYADYLRNVLQHPSVKAVLTWGLTDRDTWLNHSNPRKDGLPERPLPFDADLRPTRAYFAMREQIANAPARSLWHSPQAVETGMAHRRK